MAVATETIATWIIGWGAADTYWRAELPARYLGAKVIKVPQEKTHSFTTPNWSRKRGKFRWRLTDDGAEYFGIDGTAIWTRPDLVRAIHGAAMSANGMRVICEVDDNYLSPMSQNIFMRQYNFDEKARLGHMKAFASMDAIICSTRWLRDEYHRTFKKELRHVPDLYVARNHVDDSDARWQPQNRTWGRLRVGIQGSHQHIHDWRLAAPALHLAKEMGCEIVFMGLDPAQHDPKWREFLGEYTHLPWDVPDVYHTKHIPFDIGLAPLVTNRHTLGKSDVKALEYTMSGAACVLQNNEVYNREWRHGETAMLAGSPDEMAMMLRHLIIHRRDREQLVANARAYVAQERTVQGNLHEWREAIDGG